MKKLLMLMVCCFMAMPAFAVKNCEYIDNLKNRKNLTEGTMEALEIEQNQGFVCDANVGGSDECEYGRVILKMQEAGSDLTPDHSAGVWMCADDNGAVDRWRQNVKIEDCGEYQYDATKRRTELVLVDGKYLMNKKGWTKIRNSYRYEGIFPWSSKGGTMSRDELCLVADENLRKCLEAQKEDSRVNIVKGDYGFACNCGDNAKWNKSAGRCEEGLVAQNKSCDGTPHGGVQLYMGKAGNCNSEEAMGKAGENVEQCTRECDNGKWKEWTIIKCKDGYNHVGNKCVKKDSEQKTCRETRLTNAGKACCDTPYANNWDEKTQTCSCGNGEKFEVYDTNRGRCVKVPDDNDNDNNNDNVVPHDDNDNVYSCGEIPNLTKWCVEADNVIIDMRKYCKTNRDADEYGYNEYIFRISDAIKQCELKNAADERMVADLTKGLFSKYDEMTGDVSVWKNKEGEFNTARLASDSIAGVVLGTAGGLITSKVVKKSQVKSGFEDVQCTIGGQKVADWGDEFTVGIQ